MCERYAEPVEGKVKPNHREKNLSTVRLCTPHTACGLVRIETRVPFESEDEGNTPPNTPGSLTSTRCSIEEGFDLQTVLDAIV